MPTSLLVLTDRSQCSSPLADVIAAAIDAGARTVVLREKDLPRVRRAHLAAALRALLEPVDGVLVVTGPLAARVGVQAVHLSAGDPFPRPRPTLVGRSCHDARELAAAAFEGCDYVTVSPVFPTQSKPGYGPPLGVAGLARLLASAPPAYALGGVSPADVQPCVAAGAVGVAVMGAVMRDPGSVAAYLEALQEVST